MTDANIIKLEHYLNSAIDNIGKPDMAIKTGIAALDNKIRGLYPGEVTILAGRSSMGKTSCSIDMMIEISRTRNVLLFSLEMSGLAVVQRMLCNLTGIPFIKIRSNEINGVQTNLIKDAAKKLNAYNLFIDDTTNTTAVGMRKTLKQLVDNGTPVDCVFIDHLQLMSLINSVENRNQELSIITTQIHNLAKEFNVAVVLLSQLNRRTEYRDNKRPTLGDLRDCFSKETSLVYEHGCKNVSLDNTEFVYNNGYYIDKGEEVVYRVTTKSGRFVDVTKGQYLLTDCGYKKLTELSTEDRLVGALNWPELDNHAYIPYSKLVGWWLGNGSCRAYQSPSIVFGNNEIAKEFEAEFYNQFNYRPNIKPDTRCKKAITYEMPNYLSPNNTFRHFLKLHDLYGYYSWEKKIPDWFVATANKASWCELLEGLWETDGTVVRIRNRRNRWYAKYTTASQVMAKQILMGLAFIGVYAKINDEYDGNVNHHRLYNITIDSHWRVVFQNKVKLHGNRNCCDLFVGAGSYGGNGNTFSMQQSKNLSSKHGFRWQNKHTNYWYLQSLGDTEWVNKVPDPIVSITKCSPVPVFDKVVDHTHNLVVNGLVCHNSGSIEQSADTILMLYREGYYNTLYNTSAIDDGSAEILIAKNRNGETCSVNCMWDSTRMSFVPRLILNMRDNNEEEF